MKQASQSLHCSLSCWAIAVCAAAIGCAVLAPGVTVPVTAQLGGVALFGSAALATDDLSATFSVASADEMIHCRGTLQLFGSGEAVGSATCAPGDGKHRAAGFYYPATRLMTLVLLQ